MAVMYGRISNGALPSHCTPFDLRTCSISCISLLAASKNEPFFLFLMPCYPSAQRSASGAPGTRASLNSRAQPGVARTQLFGLALIALAEMVPKEPRNRKAHRKTKSYVNQFQR